MASQTINKTVVGKLIIVGLLCFFSCVANAGTFSPPVGCEANAYIATVDTNGYVNIDFYLNDQWQCSETLSKQYTANLPANSSLTVLYSMDGIDEANENLQFLFYFLFALMLAFIFIKGISIVNS